jgi:hypothetical protein
MIPNDDPPYDPDAHAKAINDLLEHVEACDHICALALSPEFLCDTGTHIWLRGVAIERAFWREFAPERD